MKYKVSVIIPVWNCWELTHNCLVSLRENTPGGFMQVVVVDNGSDDETARSLPVLGKELFGPAFSLARNPENLGFARACNQGAASAQAELLFFLNNDTLVQPGWLPPLMAALRDDSRLGACGPLLLYPHSEQVQHLGIAFSPTLATEHLYANFPVGHRVVTQRRRLQAITGAAFLVSRQLFDAAGRFHEGYVNGSEDLELCARIGELGKTLAVAPRSRIIHLESQTPGRSDHDQENAELLNSRCRGAFIPDLHRHARRDGFDLALTPWLDLFICLPAEHEQAMNADFAPGFLEGEKGAGLEIAPGLWWEGLQKEPLWRTGYELLASFLEANGQYQEASGVRLLQCSFFPLLPNFRALALAASRAGNDELFAQADRKIEFIISKIEDLETLLDKADKLKNWAERVDEPELAALYSDWQDELTPLS
ncbi:MAG: glycosyltransferase family 2 protein [Desulfovibrionaceae bacterium]|nr:glycosyltransferase family 2 protein [Desulfovibrionaceae bacterium]